MSYAESCNLQLSASIPRLEAGTTYANDIGLSDDGLTMLVVSQSGSVYVLRRSCNTWTLAQTLTVAADLTIAAVISPSGQFVFVSLPNANADTGEVVVFTLTNGSYVQHSVLTASDAQVDARFGDDLDIADEQTLVVGASFPSSAGRAYVFTRQNDGTWLETSLLTAGNTGDFFGTSLAVSKGACTILVGAPGSNLTGAAHVFKKRSGAYVNTQTIVGDTNDFFGSFVDISRDGRILAIGGYEDSTISERGTYIYAQSGCQYKESAFIPGAIKSIPHLAKNGKLLVVGEGTATSTGSILARFYYSCDSIHWTERQVITNDLSYQSAEVAITEDGCTFAFIGRQSIPTDNPILVYSRKKCKSH